ncbi:MAG: alpha/beta fold hydrolase [Alphaproteobacteria bacterium]|nr:alpha/beta fold hydrolase [Alphaproteobacteria bacterium]MCB9975169.1 alpha/beta fold hydrolase [Rhodospirillales bacterium]
MRILKILIVVVVVSFALLAAEVMRIAAVFNGPFPGAPLAVYKQLPRAEPVDFVSKSGVQLQGSLISGEKGRGVVLLLHGHNVHRNILIRRARFLTREGYTVFMFDFQGHGQSGEEAVTMGYRESQDVEAAMELLRARYPDEQIAIVATSMGAASVIARGEAVESDAYVLECMYYSLPELIERRLGEKYGRGFASILTPLILWEQILVVGYDPRAVAPGRAVSTITKPVLYIAADQDQYVTLEESMDVFERITAPKELWVIKGQRHGDFSHTVPDAYEKKVLEFLAFRLRVEEQNLNKEG